MRNFSKDNGKFVVYLLVGILIIGGIVVGTVNAQSIKNQLNSWKLLPQPERLTELYFNNSSNLPSTYSPTSNQTFSFTVHNLEYENYTYHYTVTAVGNTSLPLQSGSFSLEQNQYKNIPVSRMVPDIGSRIRIVVTLSNPNQSIDYWVNRSGS